MMAHLLSCFAKHDTWTSHMQLPEKVHAAPGGCSTESQLSPYYIANTSAVCDTNNADGAPIPDLGTPGTAYECPSYKLNSGPLWMGLGCLAIMTILMSRNFKVAP